MNTRFWLMKRVVTTLSVIGLMALAGCAPTGDTTSTLEPGTTDDTTTLEPGTTTEPTDGSADVTTLTGKTWTLESLIVDGQDVTLEPDVASTIEFKTDGTYGGNAGCNTYGGDYTADDEGALNLGQPTATLMACDVGMDQEGMFLTAIEQISSFRVDPTGLQLSSADNQTVMTFVAG